MDTVKRKAMPGDKIIIMDDVIKEEGHNRETFTVSDRKCSPGFVVTTDGLIFKHSEYEVIVSE